MASLKHPYFSQCSLSLTISAVPSKVPFLENAIFLRKKNIMHWFIFFFSFQDNFLFSKMSPLVYTPQKVLDHLLFFQCFIHLKHVYSFQALSKEKSKHWHTQGSKVKWCVKKFDQHDRIFKALKSVHHRLW